MVKVSRRKNSEVWRSDIPESRLNQWGHPAKEFFTFSRTVWRSETEYESLWIPKHHTYLQEQKDWVMME
tara:strand:+ start:3132 stop:3338 length:207 start_codon:yes stop_codon:yes gene_type:complete